tara:strand:+ start:667 stop:915 length:249 start_codon:yes stop_codon:yes gene_type:complete
MKIYKVYMDLQLVIPRLREFRLKEYNSTFPIVFIEAKDPDDACYKAIYNLVSGLLSQDSSVETSLLCRSIVHDIRIIKVSPS